MLDEIITAEDFLPKKGETIHVNAYSGSSQRTAERIYRRLKMLKDKKMPYEFDTEEYHMYILVKKLTREIKPGRIPGCCTFIIYMEGEIL